ncbi:hypothetical protein, partial [Paenibacillus hemerocallicola]|uniref:hypothetical protein n=1 Tax=Paenibacillus hemerocallicola TaxID=1172614 RepID=UPI001C402EF5
TMVGPNREIDANSAHTNLIWGTIERIPLEIRLAEGYKVETSTMVGPNRETDANSAEINLVWA